MKIVLLTKGYSATVSDRDFARIAQRTWTAQECFRKDGTLKVVYAYRQENGTKIYMHRFILRETNPRILIDHRDLDGLNNCRRNLRRASRSTNQINGRVYRSSSSGKRGVFWSTHAQRWQARIGKDYKQYHVGFFDTAEEASRAYQKAARKLFGRFSRYSES